MTALRHCRAGRRRWNSRWWRRCCVTMHGRHGGAGALGLGRGGAARCGGRRGALRAASTPEGCGSAEAVRDGWVSRSGARDSSFEKSACGVRITARGGYPAALTPGLAETSAHRPARPESSRDRRGAVALLFALLAPLLLLAVAFGSDVPSWYRDALHLQGLADRAALSAGPLWADGDIARQPSRSPKRWSPLMAHAGSRRGRSRRRQGL